MSKLQSELEIYIKIQSELDHFRCQWRRTEKLIPLCDN